MRILRRNYALFMYDTDTDKFTILRQFWTYRAAKKHRDRMIATVYGTARIPRWKFRIHRHANY